MRRQFLLSNVYFMLLIAIKLGETTIIGLSGQLEESEIENKVQSLNSQKSLIAEVDVIAITISHLLMLMTSP